MQACQSSSIFTARRCVLSAAKKHQMKKQQKISTIVKAQEFIATDKAPAAAGPYSQGIKVCIKRLDYDFFSRGLIGFFLLSFLLTLFTLFISLFPSLAASSTRAAASRSSRKPWKSSKVASKQKRDKRWRTWARFWKPAVLTFPRLSRRPSSSRTWRISPKWTLFTANSSTPRDRRDLRLASRLCQKAVWLKSMPSRSAERDENKNRERRDSRRRDSFFRREEKNQVWGSRTDGRQRINNLTLT